MGKYDSLYSYIEFLETATEETVTQWGGITVENGVLPHASYDSRITDLIDEFNKSDLVDRKYSSTLRRYGLDGSSVAGAVNNANYELLKAIFTFYVRGERFCDGMWASAVEDKVFYGLLKRLKELEEEVH